MSTLDIEMAERMAAIALGHVERPYPYAPQHVVAGACDFAEPRVLHPIFFGSFDWHSAVHSHWLLARLLRLFPQMSCAGAIAERFERAFTAAHVEAERAYLDRPTARGFERPYGWAWLLMLAEELRRLESGEGRTWRAMLSPLADALAARLGSFLPKADYPLRAGVHSNTAFALALALEYARGSGKAALAALIEAKARAWYAADRDCQAWEPSGDDFLSPALMEAELMRRILPAAEFRAWFAAFLPHAGAGAPASLFAPARVSDRSDGKIAHLDGLNLSRAWCWRGIAPALELGDPVRQRALDAAERHLAAALPHLAGDYMGEHWLASFALLALSAPVRSPVQSMRPPPQ